MYLGEPSRPFTPTGYMREANVSMAHPSPSQVMMPFTGVQLTTVRPLEKTAHVETIDPTVVDSFLTDCYVLFAYRLADKSEEVYTQMVKRIKESLQKVLISFFSFAGRWVAVSPGSMTRKLLCNDEGVPFIEAYMETDLDSVVQASTLFQPVQELQGYGWVGMDITQFQQPMPPEGAPPIFIQITRFKCGGLVLAVTFNHMHVDAEGFFHFMTAWSELCRTNGTAVKVDHNRAQVEVPFLRALLPARAVTEAASTDGIDDAKPVAKLGPWAMKSYEVCASTIKSLKEEAKDHPEGQGYVSTGDCVVAQLWKSLEGLPSSLLCGKELAISRIVEGRTKFYDPPLPDVCGNVYTLLLPPKIPTNELLEMPLVSVASRLRDKLKIIRREEWLGLEMSMKALKAFGSKERMNFWTSSWFNFRMYEMDFGFGKPYFSVAPNSNYYGVGTGIGMAIIFPPIPNSSSSVATVHLWSTPNVFQALESNPQFLSFFGVQY